MGNGFSGNRLSLKTIRKTAASPERNGAIMREYVKLKVLREISTRVPVFQVPQLYESGTDRHGRAWYEMEFIEGDHPKTVAPLIPVMERLAECESERHEPAEPYLMRKLEGRELDLRGLEIPHHNGASYCHGDLTPENVIMRCGVPVLLDPLPNDHETYLWDAAKLMQTAYGWEYIRDGRFEIEGGMVWVARNPYTPEHRQVADLVDPELLALYSAAVYARIIPYAKNAAQREALLVITQELLDRFKTRSGLNEPLDSVCWPIK